MMGFIRFLRGMLDWRTERAIRKRQEADLLRLLMAIDKEMDLDT